MRTARLCSGPQSVAASRGSPILTEPYAWEKKEKGEKEGGMMRSSSVCVHLPRGRTNE